MNRMSFGQYVPGTSPLHKMNGFTKLVCFFLLVAAIILADTFLGYLITAVCILMILHASKISIGTAFSAIRRLWFFFLLILVMNTLFFETEEALWSWWIFHPSITGMQQGAHILLKIILVMLCAHVLTSATSTLELTKSIERLLIPLGWLHIPTGNIAMILGVALQFIPTFLEEAETIMRAQMARGAVFESKKCKDKASGIIPLVLPVFLSAFRRADELSVAMEARGYRTTKKRRTKKLSLQKRDFLAFALSFVLCLIQLIL